MIPAKIPCSELGLRQLLALRGDFKWAEELEFIVA